MESFKSWGSCVGLVNCFLEPRILIGRGGGPTYPRCVVFSVLSGPFFVYLAWFVYVFGCYISLVFVLFCFLCLDDTLPLPPSPLLPYPRDCGRFRDALVWELVCFFSARTIVALLPEADLALRGLRI